MSTSNTLNSWEVDLVERLTCWLVFLLNSWEVDLLTGYYGLKISEEDLLTGFYYWIVWRLTCWLVFIVELFKGWLVDWFFYVQQLKSWLNIIVEKFRGWLVDWFLMLKSWEVDTWTEYYCWINERLTFWLDSIVG